MNLYCWNMTIWVYFCIYEERKKKNITFLKTIITANNTVLPDYCKNNNNNKRITFVCKIIIRPTRCRYKYNILCEYVELQLEYI